MAADCAQNVCPAVEAVLRMLQDWLDWNVHDHGSVCQGHRCCSEHIQLSYHVKLKESTDRRWVCTRRIRTLQDRLVSLRPWFVAPGSLPERVRIGGR